MMSDGPNIAYSSPDEPGYKHPDVFYEHKDVWVRLVLFTLLGLMVTILVSAAVLWHFYGQWRAAEYGGEDAAALSRQYSRKMMPPPPQLFKSPSNPISQPDELRQMREDAQRTLNSYGWVDQQANVARIPITEAMKLLAQRGLGTPPRSTARPNENESQ